LPPDALVDRLRDVDEPNALIVRRRAADEIERLRAALETICTIGETRDVQVAEEALRGK
jgi:hypothetical protein